MHANKDEADKCLLIAKRALQQDPPDYGKAEKFANKAMQMHRSDEVEQLMVQIKLAQHSSRPASQQQQRGQEPSEQHEGHGAQGHRSSQPAGMRSSHLHQRRAAASQPVEEDLGTPEQKKLVREILAASDLYAILSIPKTSTDDDIRAAYRKLALKLHPDKNKAHKADEAFKAVGKAYACLSDPDKRAYYDRTGYESTAAAQAAQAASRQGGGGGYGQGAGGMYYQADFDADEIFNMFFGGMNPHARMFRAQFGGQPQRRRQQQAQQQQASGPQDDMARLVMNLLQFLPVILLVVISMFAASHKPPFALVRDHQHYPDSMTTVRLEVPFFVKNTLEFERSYPRGSHARYKLERQIETDYYERQAQRCQSEKITKHRMWSYGRKEEADRMQMTACDEVDRINAKLGHRNNYSQGWAW